MISQPNKLIRNATIYDGTGNTPFKGDVMISGERISVIGPGLNCEDCEIIDAGGLALAPGFIDCHAHSDISILAAPEAAGKISQGVTTEINGNCGLSAFPVTTENREHLGELYRNYGIKIDWTSFPEYVSQVSAVRPSINPIYLTGHNTLRAAVRGYKEGKADRTKIAAMSELLDKCLKAGAAGLSLGLLYTPGCFAGKDEITALMQVVGNHNKICTVHLRSEGNELVEALNETVEMAFEADLKKLHISHLKTGGQENWHKLPQAMSIISRPPAGMRITFDRYPYTESMTSLSVLIPPPYDKFNDVTLQKKMSEELDFYNQVVDALKQLPDERWTRVRLVSSKADQYTGLLGLQISESAKSNGVKPAELCAKILRDDATGAMAAFKGMNEDNMRSIIRDPRGCCGSDETARPFSYELGRSHPRGFGSFPRYFNILKESMALEHIIRKVTSLPAGIFGIKDRGMIRPGYFADLVLFDPGNYMDYADFKAPHSPAKGVHKVMVNGTMCYEDGSITGRNGQVILV